MSRCLVTGAAGFIGSHLCETLIEKGHEVVGIDAFIPYYPRPLKEDNLRALRTNPAFTFHEVDLREGELHGLVRGCDTIVNEAAMAGLMKSWSEFTLYASCNQHATLRLLEAARDEKVPHFIQISTSSVYGKEATGDEQSPLSPFSPYGITKLAGEQLCRAFSENFGVPTTVLRYFSVYGPRQRPDMAYNILVRKILNGEVFQRFGDGEQTRSNTFVADAVQATLLAVKQPEKSIGETFNIGGGKVISLNSVIEILEELVGKKCVIEEKAERPGDQRHTVANFEKASRILGYKPAVAPPEGLKAQVDWQLPLIAST